MFLLGNVSKLCVEFLFWTSGIRLAAMLARSEYRFVQFVTIRARAAQERTTDKELHHAPGPAAQLDIGTRFDSLLIEPIRDVIIESAVHDSPGYLADDGCAFAQTSNA